MSNLVDVTGFENLQNCTQLNGLFMGCERLETVYATSFDNTNVNAVTGMFSGCAALVSAGNRAGAWVSGGTKEMLAVGEDGYLIAPGQDPRVRMYWYAYENGSKYDLEVTLTQGADPLRTLAHEGSCFAGVGYTFSYLRQPWYAIADKIANVDLDASLAAYDGMHVENWFWECEAIESITGIANLRGVESLSGTFAFRHATPMTVVDLRGLVHSARQSCIMGALGKERKETAMSIENASRFVTEAHARDRKVLALLPGGTVPDAVGAEEFAAVAKAARDAGWDFTADELQEAYLDSLEMTELDEGEFEAVAGGESERCYDNAWNVGNGSSGYGGCKSNYYVENCRASVDPGSVCNCTDYKEDNYTKC